MKIVCSIPPSKNSKKMLNRNTGFMQRTQEFNNFMEDMNYLRLKNLKEINSFVSFWSIGKLIKLEIQIYQSSQRSDIHNHLEVLLDGLQLYLDINDKYYVPVMLPRLFCELCEERIEINATIIDDPFMLSKKSYKRGD